MQVAAAQHVPVMYDQMLSFMSAKDGETYVDGTFGAGGYTRGLLEAASCNVIAIDRDKQVLPTAEVFSKEYHERFALLLGAFGDMDRLVKEHGVEKVDGVVLDIGVSSMQLDQPERGFSFQADGPLDMRMGDAGPSAADPGAPGRRGRRRGRSRRSPGTSPPRGCGRGVPDPPRGAGLRRTRGHPVGRSDGGERRPRVGPRDR